MILRLTIDDRAADGPRDVEVDVRPETLVGAVLDDPSIKLGTGPCYVGRTLLSRDQAIADSPLVHGAVIKTDERGDDLRAPDNSVGVLHFTGGDDPRFPVALGPGVHVVPCHPDGSSSLQIALDIVEKGPVTLVTTRTSADVLVNGVKVRKDMVLSSGDRIRLGTVTAVWWRRDVPVEVVTARRDGRLEFDRPYAPAPTITSTAITLPAEDNTPVNIVGQIMSAIVPIFVGGFLAVFLRQYFTLLFAVTAPATVGVSIWVARRSRAKKRREYDRLLAAATGLSDRHIADERQRREASAPGVDELIRVCVGASRGLWPRNRETPTGLSVRLGLGDLPAAVELRPGPAEDFPQPIVADVPIVADLRAAGVLGLVGPGPHVDGLARWIVLQLAVLRGPDDLRLVLISAADDDAELAWASWLPHTDGRDVGNMPCWIGNTDETRKARVAELRDLVRGRMAGPRDPGEQIDEVVAVLRGAAELRALPGMKEVLKDGPSVGVHIIAVDRYDTNEWRAVCEVRADRTVGFRSSPDQDQVTVRMDGITHRYAMRMARAMAPMRDRLAGSQTSIPYPARMLDLFNVRIPTPENIAALWRGNPGPTTQVVVGVAESGRPAVVDLAADGPHTMLGGATGAGKSYLLQALVTSLLMVNRPDELNLVLVDFKGGGAFRPFAGCPHVVSLIVSTNKTEADVFDATAAARVLASIKAEVSRREFILKDYGGEIRTYWSKRITTPSGALPALPRLVMVFDEFARVLDVSPDFQRELVNVAGKGRSLGMHLILATQSLQGKLSAELKNNIDLRISLRQNEAADSTEVLGVPDAAFIPGHLHGRGMILCTKDQTRTPRPFQSGFLGGMPPKEGLHLPKVVEVPWSELGIPRGEAQREDAGAKDQDLVLDAIVAAAATLRIPPPFRPLLPPLEAVVTLADLPAEPAGGWLVPYGLIDDPVGQQQPVAALNLAGTDSLMVAGGPQSGRTTFVRTLLTSIVTRFRADQVQFYIVEQKRAGLEDFGPAANCGGWFGPSEPDRIRRLVTWLDREVDRRKGLALSGGAAGDPKIVVVIDGWELFENRTDQSLVETSVLRTLRRVITDGATVGIHVVAIGGQAMLEGRLPAAYARRLVLPFPKLETRKAHLPARAVNPPILPGRAVDATTAHQVQICLAETIVLDTRRPDVQIQRFPALPVDVTIPELRLPVQRPPRWVPIGRGGPDVATVGVDLFDAGSNVMLVSGAPGSGRTNALATIVRGLRNLPAPIPVLIVSPSRSWLYLSLPRDPDIVALRGSTIRDDELRAAVEPFGDRPYAVVVDDCEQITLVPDTLGFPSKPTLLDEIASPAALGRQALVLGGDAMPLIESRLKEISGSVTKALRDNHHVLLLCPPNRRVAGEHRLSSLEADQFFVGPPGRGYLTTGRDVALIQIALAAEDPAEG